MVSCRLIIRLQSLQPALISRHQQVCTAVHWVCLFQLWNYKLLTPADLSWVPCSQYSHYCLYCTMLHFCCLHSNFISFIVLYTCRCEPVGFYFSCVCCDFAFVMWQSIRLTTIRQHLPSTHSVRCNWTMTTTCMINGCHCTLIGWIFAELQ